MMQGERADGKLDWMYKPIVKTLSAGFNASLRAASDSSGTLDYWTIRESVLDQKPKTASSPKGSIDCGEVARATATLTE